jgi:hypothetical protein
MVHDFYMTYICCTSRFTLALFEFLSRAEVCAGTTPDPQPFGNNHAKIVVDSDAETDMTSVVFQEHVHNAYAMVCSATNAWRDQLLSRMDEQVVSGWRI